MATVVAGVILGICLAFILAGPIAFVIVVVSALYNFIKAVLRSR